jgi:predicted DNA-binding antitoxin AbrB/MazE fold protein
VLPTFDLHAARAAYNLRIVMSIKVAFRDGVFEPLEKVDGAKPGTIYTVFSEAELRDLGETLGWLKVAEKSFEFWDNAADAIYDTL